MAETTQSTAIQIAPVVAVGEFADKLGVPATKVIGELMKNGVMATINEPIDFDTAAIIGAELGFDIIPEPTKADQSRARRTLAEGEEGAQRPPVVAVTGHVDHGKTSLLDAIRSTDVATGEAGGITQHIGAYQVKRNDRWITFLDTPGHSAFSAIRAHGARMADVAIIVIAADDGIKPQTREAIRYAQESGVKMVVAINKIDKEGADPNRVKTELSELQIVPEEWGGDTVMVEVSAKANQNIDKLLDVVLLVADLEDLRARPEGPAEGVVIESHLESGRGAVATVLVQHGQLKIGDFIGSGSTYAKVRSLHDWHGRKLTVVNPGMPAVLTGFKEVPAFGDFFEAYANEKAAREAAGNNLRGASIKSLVKVKKIDASQLTDAITAGNIKELNVVVKADVQGSLESLLDALGQLRNDEVAVKVVSSSVGEIGETDVTFAKTAGAMLIGFNVGMGAQVRQLAQREGIQARLYKVIYELLDDVRGVLGQMLAPEVVETVHGQLELLGIFKATKTYVVCGGEVKSGKVEAKQLVRISRGGEQIGEATVSAVQKGPNQVKEAVEGEQCGLNLATTAKIEIGDTLEFYTKEEKARTLEI